MAAAVTAFLNFFVPNSFPNSYTIEELLDLINRSDNRVDILERSEKIIQVLECTEISGKEDTERVMNAIVDFVRVFHLYKKPILEELQRIPAEENTEFFSLLTERIHSFDLLD